MEETLITHSHTLRDARTPLWITAVGRIVNDRSRYFTIHNAKRAPRIYPVQVVASNATGASQVVTVTAGRWCLAIGIAVSVDSPFRDHFECPVEDLGYPGVNIFGLA